MDGGDTPLVDGYKTDCSEPDSQGQMGAVHNGSGYNSGLMVAGAVLVGVPTMGQKELLKFVESDLLPCAMLMPSCFLSGDIIAWRLHHKTDNYKILWFAELGR